MKILIAEDDNRLRKNIVHIIQKEFHQVDAVDNGQHALEYILFHSYDLVILDWMMPELSGIDVCKEARRNGYEGGILILTAKDDSNDIILGLDAGADDYVVKPFKMEELLARIRAILRRKNKSIHQIIQIDDLKLYLDSRTLYKDNQEILLTKNEFLLLEYLFINKGIILTREQIYTQVWGFDHEMTNNNLDALVKLVRKKIDYNRSKSIIENIRGIGYRVR
ncbi:MULTISPECIES: response regulator transcription factor [Lysinibacillus]|uniref:response regulator transcription factor n=1 Tax=Lysinibacillus TaxID=400634 RepID=UPI001C8C9758|nr:MULTISPECIES: response regulator transcription factor [Lysinibacillus]WHP42533.1 response regulator transcription factor [Lysinibacillus boronitolerans]MBX8946441.1 response regulator transcription factor [Lysinibacillus sp. K60]UNT57582.1 response regulator transcription factor [Lysinibacillus capsici]UYB45420.1 response regulator transcription factor [Lysinibacillus capsici]WDU77622.1 response regulator transcription factor [Lysinibacillus sp. G01H]